MSTHRCLLLEWQQAVSRPHLADGTQFILIALEEIRSRVAMWLVSHYRFRKGTSLSLRLVSITIGYFRCSIIITVLI